MYFEYELNKLKYVKYALNMFNIHWIQVKYTFNAHNTLMYIKKYRHTIKINEVAINFVIK
jgi:hypothetical protein